MQKKKLHPWLAHLAHKRWEQAVRCYPLAEQLTPSPYRNTPEKQLILSGMWRYLATKRLAQASWFAAAVDTPTVAFPLTL